MSSPGHRWFAAVFDWMSRHEGRGERRFREAVASGAQGRVLEIGFGVGSNWTFLPDHIDYVGIEPDPYMRRRAEAHRPQGRALPTLAADAQRLPFADGAFDSVIATLVFCTIPDAPVALAEVRRVLKPGGEFRFWEHVRSTGGTGARLQRALTPAWKRLGGGCHLDRDTLAAIRGAGFEVEDVRRVKIGPLPAIVGSARWPAAERPAPEQA